MGPEKFLRPEKFWVRKNCGSEKIVGPTTFESEKYLESKIVGPPLPYDIGLSKVGWIGRRGVGGWDGGSIHWL